SHDDVSMRRPAHAGQVPHLRGSTLRLSGHGSVALEMPSLRPLALARPGDDPRRSDRTGRARGQAGRLGVCPVSGDRKHLGILQLRRIPRCAPRGPSKPLRCRGRTSDNRMEMRDVQTPSRILVVDDEPDLVTILTKYFSEAGYAVDAAQHGGDALIAVSQYRPDVVVLDVMMEGLNGVQVLERIRALDPAIRVIMISGSPDVTL